MTILSIILIVAGSSLAVALVVALVVWSQFHQSALLTGPHASGAQHEAAGRPVQRIGG